VSAPESQPTSAPRLGVGTAAATTSPPPAAFMIDTGTTGNFRQAVRP